MSTQCVGVDIFVVSTQTPQVPEKNKGLELKHITNRGSKVWPGKSPSIEMTDLFTLRYQKAGATEVSDLEILELLQELSKGHQWVHVEKLQRFNGVDRFA